MARLVFTVTASSDQAEILAYLQARAGRQTAVKFRELFRGLFDRLAAYPSICSLRPKLGKDIRVGIVAPYVVIYRYVELQNLVLVLRLVDGRRKISGKLLRSDG